MISYSLTVLGCEIDFRIAIYLVTLLSSSEAIILSLYMILMATSYSVALCFANLTFPKVPSPTVFPEFK